MSADVAGIVDSGADGTLFPLELAPALGLDVEKDLVKQDGSSGAAGTTFETWAARKPITGRVFAIMRPGESAEFFGEPFELSPAFAADGPVLWGRSDFFTNFTITFHTHEHLGLLLTLEQ